MLAPGAPTTDMLMHRRKQNIINCLIICCGFFSMFTSIITYIYLCRLNYFQTILVVAENLLIIFVIIMLKQLYCEGKYNK